MLLWLKGKRKEGDLSGLEKFVTLKLSSWSGLYDLGFNEKSSFGAMNNLAL